MHSLTVLMIYFHLLLTNSEFPKIFWTYWESGLEGHPFIRMFDDQHRKMVEKDGWVVRLLNKSTVLTYLR